ncbi:pheromone-processing carboxypeptidase KEX1-like [Nasonia vitripennis]|uniref:BEN domain-containing protein n=1 Tax=Nasonia vitripennis TaxID=7425 RepID=A0A7M7Q2V2_NASVI|nr:pheromone-processing carboxypeptidase KEX1-like [Nasonia vitripennis]
MQRINCIHTVKKNKKGSEYSGFVRHIAETIFGSETLKNSSVTGRQSGRTKAPAKPKLDPKLLGAVIGIFQYYLVVEVKLDPVRVSQEVKSTGEHIASKIADMNRKSKKKICDPEGASNNALANVETEVTVNLNNKNQPEARLRNEDDERSNDDDDDENSNDDDENGSDDDENPDDEDSEDNSESDSNNK